MKIRKPSFIGSAAWAIYFLILFGAIFVVMLVVSQNIAVGIGLFFLMAVVLGVGSRWVLSTVGYVDTEFVVGLLLAAVLGLAGFTVVGELHGSSSESHVHATARPPLLANNLPG